MAIPCNMMGGGSSKERNEEWQKGESILKHGGSIVTMLIFFTFLCRPKRIFIRSIYNKGERMMVVTDAAVIQLT